MPQTSPEVIDRMYELFPDADGDFDTLAQGYLEDRGFTLGRDFFWIAPPHYREWIDLLQDEQLCIIYLIEEWDFGGVHFDG